MKNLFRSFFKSVLLKQVQYRSAHGRLRALYSMEDPWNLSSPKEQFRFEAINSVVSELLRDVPDPAILELGCGEGHHSAVLKQVCSRLYGIDVSDLAVSRARTRNPDCIFETGLIEEAGMIFPNTHFDLVVASETLYYLKDLAGTMDRLKSITPRLLVTNLHERHEKIERHLTGAGWREIEPIERDGTKWACCVWSADMRKG